LAKRAPIWQLLPGFLAVPAQGYVKVDAMLLPCN